MENLRTISLAWDAVLKIVVLTGILSSGLAALGMWIVLRLTKPLDSYTEEFAKQVARHQNLDKLVEETRRFTDVAEKIKADFSHETWDRQTRFLGKQDLYVKIAEALGEFRTFSVAMKRVESLRLQGAALGPDGAIFEEKRKELLQAFEGARDKLLHATDVAPLIIPDEPYKPLLQFKPRQIRHGTPLWEKDFEYNIAKAQSTLYHFQVAARADLGFAPMVWKPIILTPPPPEPDSSAESSSE
jgi:hypothetical protein